MHHQNIHWLLLEIFEVFIGVTENEIVKNTRIYKNTINYNLSSQADLRVCSVNLIYKGLNPFKYYGTIIWTSFPLNKKNISSCQNLKYADDDSHE